MVPQPTRVSGPSCSRNRHSLYSPLSGGRKELEFARPANSIQKKATDQFRLAGWPAPQQGKVGMGDREGLGRESTRNGWQQSAATDFVEPHKTIAHRASHGPKKQHQRRLRTETPQEPPKSLVKTYRRLRTRFPQGPPMNDISKDCAPSRPPRRERHQQRLRRKVPTEPPLSAALCSATIHEDVLLYPLPNP